MPRPAEMPVLANDMTLQVYLLGSVDFDAALRLQRRLHFEIAGDRNRAVLLVCEHPPAISVGRLGSHAHVRGGDDLAPPLVPLRWVNRGGGCIPHMPGQLAIYPIFPLDRLGLDVASYLARLGQACLDVTADFSLRAPARADDTGVWVGDRLLAAFGIAVRDWVSCFGIYFNAQPPLDVFRMVQPTRDRRDAMTSLERERRGPVRPAMVRQRLIEHMQTRFGFAQTALFTDHPDLSRAGNDIRERHAVASRY